VIRTLWLVAHSTGAGVVIAGIIGNRWHGWLNRPWWYVVATLTAASSTGWSLATGRLPLAALYSVTTLLAGAFGVVTARRTQSRRVERWDGS